MSTERERERNHEGNRLTILMYLRPRTLLCLFHEHSSAVWEKHTEFKMIEDIYVSIKYYDKYDTQKLLTGLVLSI